jgi:hypothetical protein
VKKASYEIGDAVGKWTGRYYAVWMVGEPFHAHRIVYYMRTGTNPENADVVHGPDNPEKDNRKELTLYLRNQNPKKERKQLWRRDGILEKEFTHSNGKPQLQIY